MKNIFKTIGLFTLLILSGCGKDEIVIDLDNNETKELVVKDGNFELLSDDFTITNSLDGEVTDIQILDTAVINNLDEGAVIINSDTANAFLVKVTKKEGDIVSVEPASLNEYFSEGSFEFGSQLATSNGLNKKEQEVEFSAGIEVEIAEDEFAVTLSGQVDFTPDIKGEIGFNENSFLATIKDAPLDITLSMAFSITDEEAYKEEQTVLLGTASKTVLHGPVLTTYRVKFYDDIIVTGSGAIEATYEVTFNNEISTEVSYNGGVWDNDISFKNVSNEFSNNLEAKVGLKVEHKIRPVLEIEFFWVAGASLELTGYNNFYLDVHGQTQGDELNWGLRATTGIEGQFDVTARIFKSELYHTEFELMEETTIYEVPDAIEFTSSEELSAQPNTQLDGLIQVRVLDTEGNPVAGVLVYSNVVSGGGSFNDENTFTNSSGIANFNFTTGAEGEQETEFIVKDGAGETKHTISKSVILDGSTNVENPLIGSWAFIDSEIGVWQDGRGCWIETSDSTMEHEIVSYEIIDSSLAYIDNTSMTLNDYERRKCNLDFVYDSAVDCDYCDATDSTNITSSKHMYNIISNTVLSLQIYNDETPVFLDFTYELIDDTLRLTRPELSYLMVRKN